MSFPWGVFGGSEGSSPRPRIQLTQVPSPPPRLDEYDENASDCDPETLPSHLNVHPDHSHLAIRTPFLAASQSSPDLSAQAALRPSDRSLLYAHPGSYSSHGYVHSPYSTASNTPIPSRTSSPVPLYSSGASSCSSESESELEDAPFAGRNVHRHPRWRVQEERRRWWIMGAVRRRRRRERVGGWRTVKRGLRLLIRHPFFPKTPITILLTLLLLTTFGVSLTFLIIYILNPDKEPLPWRGYCTIPQYSTSPPSLDLPTTASFPYPPPTNFTPPSFPPDDLDSLSPAGVFVGVFSMDNAVERRMMIRSTWASHVRSRDGAGAGDGGVGTSRTVVRFILGQPRKEWNRRIRLEMDMYNDMVILPISENMNDGKTWAYFNWASREAWVPPLYFDTFEHVPSGFSYENTTHNAPKPANHDPVYARQDYATGNPQRWVRPDYVVKTDDDAFVMLAELEARLRVELHATPDDRAGSHNTSTVVSSMSSTSTFSSSTSVSLSRSVSTTATSVSPHADGLAISPPLSAVSASPPSSAVSSDPLIFWGYLVKNRFMAGELYALSWSLVEWIAVDPQVRELRRGAEDKQTSKWMRLHPRAEEVRWASERCWIYDHPRAGTVYSHGFLFPSEARRVQEGVLADIARSVPAEVAAQKAGSFPSPFGPNAPIPPTWTQSTVSKFGTRYNPPLPYLSQQTSLEALVEGSEMSQLTEASGVNPWTVWQRREGRNKRYVNQRVGGTIVVHFIKKNMWFLETAAAFLLGDDQTEAERGYRWVQDRFAAGEPIIDAPSVTFNDQNPHITPQRKHRRR
ncbi:glycosyltransferase family 31 protein [Wolfiporia cocos MD-104 SS10]|uniref:Glycosyltransferase family 31 protein n=1 Tax=Wolfiporia cocos (strain MD-104) TaxID=742152 RepID=A0A2H3J7R0_WOLCO|nr:glycosyltransferase family 31 protein [Wolfiporia cocos MD-104 SS10]